MTTDPRCGVSTERIAPEALMDGPARAARATLRDDVVTEYTEALRDGATFPPAVAFRDDAGRHWLADGRHRLEAHRKAFPGAPIAVQVLEGGELDALRHALRANAAHGLRRSPGDLQAAYRTAVAAGLVEPGDAAAVADLLECSMRHALRLSAEARERNQRARDRKIQEMRAAGATQRETAAAVGVDRTTVQRVERLPTQGGNQIRAGRNWRSSPRRVSRQSAGAKMTTYDELVAWLLEHDAAKKKSGNPQVPTCQNCQKPENPPFVSFDSTPPGVSENFTCPSSVSTWWRVYRDGEPICIVMQPGGLTAAEALRGARERWPGFRIEVGR